MAIYYHGTSRQAADCIEDEGFRGSELDDCTVGQFVEDGVVFLSDSPELAADYGDTIITVDTERAVYFQNCPATGQKEFYVKVADLEEEGAWWVE